MNQNPLFFNAIAGYMELLSQLSERLPEALTGLTQLAVDTLLYGGKLIIITDDNSDCAAQHFCQRMAYGSGIERPALPCINFNQVAKASNLKPNELLQHLTGEHDLVLVLTTKVDTLAIELRPEQSLVVTSGQHSHPTTPSLCLNVTEANHWTLSLTVIINSLSDQIEQQLFGYSA